MASKNKPTGSRGVVTDKEKKTMAGVRRVRKVGGSYYIAIPKEFLESHKIKEGDVIPFVSNHVLKFVPVKEE